MKYVSYDLKQRVSFNSMIKYLKDIDKLSPKNNLEPLLFRIMYKIKNERI